MTSREELEAAIEAILFVATEPVSSERLRTLFAEDEPATVEEALQAVIARYPGSGAQGLVADFAAGGVRLVTRPALQGWLRRFFQVTGRTKLSLAALETLAIVAYRQPITAPEIQELRGVASSTGVLKTLLDHRLVRISGRKEVVGKPFLYSTSREFLVRFGLNKLQDLPPLEELEQMLALQAEADGAEGAVSPQQALDLRSTIDPEAELDRADREEERRGQRTESSDPLELDAVEEGDVAESWPDPGGALSGEGAPSSNDRDLTDESMEGALDDAAANVPGDEVDELDPTWSQTVPDDVDEDEVEPSVAAIDWDDGLPEDE